ncbi:MAG TPA: hypothetical protein VK864_01165, partial [Longimicrobiales bacterium]|nr:hypothetical protein [Longimicrobiales bacterium]
TPPPTHDALIEFVRAMEVPRWWQAGPYYERAANLDTTFTLALIKAARAQMATNPARSQEIVETLEQNRHSLPRLQVLMLNALTASFAGDRMAEYEAWAGAAALAPAEFLYPYAMAANALYRPRETLWLLDRAEYPARAGVPPSTWLIRTDLHHQLGERREEIALARQARRARPHRLDALYKYVRGLAASGRVQEVIALIDTALNAPRDPDYTPGAIMQVAAEELRAHGFAVAAADIVEREIQWYRSTPATGADTLAHYNNLAGALYRANQWDDAARLFETLAAAHPVQRADLYGRLGAIAARRGDRALTQRYLAILKHLDWPNEGPTYEAYISCARIAALLGQESEALQYLRIAVGGQGLDLHADMDFESLRNNPDFREFTRPRG